MTFISLVVAAAGVRSVLGRFLDLDDIYPACVDICAPSVPLIEGCFQNKSVELIKCGIGVCHPGWIDDFARCVNCLNANTPELDYKTYKSRSLGLDQLSTACKLLNGNGMNETVASWEELPNTVGGKPTVIASKTRLPDAETNLDYPSSTQSGTETSGTIEMGHPSVITSSEGPGSGVGGTANLGRIIGGAVREVLGGALGGAAALALAVGVVVWLVMRKRKRLPVRTSGGFEIDSAPPYPDGATDPPIAPYAEKHLPPNYPNCPSYSYYPNSSHYPPPRTSGTLINSDVPRRPLPPLPQVPPYQPLPAYKVETLRALHPLRPVSPPESPQTTQSQDAGRIARSPLSPSGPRREVPPRYDPRWNDEEDAQPPPYGLPPGAMAPHQGGYQG